MLLVDILFFRDGRQVHDRVPFYQIFVVEAKRGEHAVVNGDAEFCRILLKFTYNAVAMIHFFLHAEARLSLVYFSGTTGTVFVVPCLTRRVLRLFRSVFFQIDQKNSDIRRRHAG